jgi:hypothetical protein
MELEQLADPGEMAAYPVLVESSGTFQIVGAELVRYVAQDMVAGISPPATAARLYDAVAASIVFARRPAGDLPRIWARSPYQAAFPRTCCYPNALRPGWDKRAFAFFSILASRPTTMSFSFGQAALASTRIARL